jgi:hypothetical protein
MNISGMSSYLNYGTYGILASSNYNTAPVQAIKSVPQNNYSLNTAVRSELNKFISIDNNSYSNLNTKTVVLDNGALFVGTIIDFFA